MAPVLVMGMGPEEKARNIERATALLRAAHAESGALVSAGRWTDLVVLPEFCFDGPASTIESLPASAEHLDDGAVLDACVGIARDLDAAILAPVYLEEGGVFYNSCVVVGSEVGGERAYRKVHRFPPEVGRVARGDSVSLAAVRGVPVGLQICYDLVFPESARLLRLRGATAIVYPTMAPDWLMARFHALAAARAIENQVFVAVVNAVGNHPRTGERLGGASIVAWPDGRTMMLGDQEEVRTVVFDLAELERTRAELDVVADRIPAFYAGLTEAQ